MADEPRTAAASGMPDFKQSVKLKYVKLGYHHLISHGAYLLLAPLPGLVAAHLSTFTLRDLVYLWQSLQYNLVSVLVCTTVLVVVATADALTRPRPVYLVDFACYKPDDERKCSRARFMNCTESLGTFTTENIEFQRRIIERSGLGEDTYLPEGVLNIPPNPSMANARKEAEMVMFGALDEHWRRRRPDEMDRASISSSAGRPATGQQAQDVGDSLQAARLRRTYYYAPAAGWWPGRAPPHHPAGRQ
ncbi:3-ketoacyl-CoA synthase 11-like [Miscanthus floridulus]|uniref:3-ketoacyl-CoA synthase 11-like n=1 Tax=Miscanthus floridulus TaxID=154761 RepID=UPI00345A17E0